MTKPRKLVCSKGHEFQSIGTYALSLPDPLRASLLGNGPVIDWCLRCLTEQFRQTIGVVSEA